MLKYNEIKVIDQYDWDNFIRQIYNKKYSFQQQDGCKEKGIRFFGVPMNEFCTEDYTNDEIPIKINGKKMGVSFKAWLSRDINDKFFEKDWENTLFWERNFYPHFSMIVNDLYGKGVLEKGNYAINIDW